MFIYIFGDLLKPDEAILPNSAIFYIYLPLIFPLLGIQTVLCFDLGFCDPYKEIYLELGNCCFIDFGNLLMLDLLNESMFQYHPDVCRGNNCGVQFHHINEAYDVCYQSPVT